MQKLFFILAVLFFNSCGESPKPIFTDDTISQPKVTVTKDEKVKNAIAFINGYVENANKMNKALPTIDWVNSNNLSTANFKSELKRITDEAFKQDPEMGLDADPVLDAQDYPDKGFELESFDEQTNYLIVKGKEWPEFKLTLKITEENGNWLVDGCGMVNIPQDKKSGR